MNRADLQQIAGIRLQDARLLLANNRYEGAYYIIGYAVECGLKACIARQTRRSDFPDRKTVNESYSHNLEQLVRVAGLQRPLRQEASADRAFEVNWSLVKDWSEESRYQRRSQREAEDLYKTVADRQHGVLRWIRRHW